MYPLVSKSRNFANPFSGSFAHLSKDEIETHLRINQYGKFRLPGAIRPSYDVQVAPVEGFRYETYLDAYSNRQAPVLICAASQEHLFDLFYDLISCFHGSTKIVLESTHFNKNLGKRANEYPRSWIDIPVFQSILVGYEKYLQSDGCMGISVVHPELLNEVRMDEHKLIYIYGRHLCSFLQVLKWYRIPYLPDMSFITDAEHVHLTNMECWNKFQQLCEELEIKV